MSSLPPTDLEVQIVDSSSDLSALAPQWRALERASGLALPFQTWEWSTSWWEHLREDRAAVRDLLRVCVVRRPSGEVVGIAPLMLTQRPGSGPLRARFLQFIGADPNLTEIRQMVCLPELREACCRAVMAALEASPREWDWIAWEGPEAADPGLFRGSSWRRSAYVLALPDSWEDLKKQLRRNIKESLRKCYNSLKRDGLTFRLEVLTEPDAVASGLEDLFWLHSARADLTGTVVHSDVFDSLQAREFMTDVCRRLARRGVARLYRLLIDERLVAIRLGFEMGDTLYLYYSGWDPAYARYSVMTTLVAEAMQDAIRRGLHFVHLSTGTDVSKTRWGTDEVRYVYRERVAPRLTAQALHRAYHSMSQLATSKTVRAIAPSFLLRRSGASLGEPGQRSDTWRQLRRVCALAAAAATVGGLDLLDGRLDGAVRVLAHLSGQGHIHL
ncbi:MAG: GNAT family N-acetyltransferase [Chloroflexi bacterium]|nr:GNAT family N-acetyltransferase [Chloroflexota bacterium]